jgi:hypothetical protein
MATPLTQAQLDAIRAGLAPQSSATGGGEAGSSYYQPSQVTYGGYNYIPNANGGYWGFADKPQWDTGSTTAGYNGSAYTSYDANGQENGSGKLSGIANDNFMNTWAPFAMVAPFFAAGAMPAVGAAMSFGANPVLAAEGAGAMGAGAAGGFSGFLGEAPWTPSGGGALDFGAGGSGFAPAGSNAAFNSATSGASLLDPSAGMTAPAASDAAFNAAVKGAASTVPTWLKVGAPLLGALAGSQPVTKSGTETINKDPRVDPFIFGSGTNPGLLGYTQQQLQRDMSPENLAALDKMKSAGLGLLSAPVAGNGFTLLTKGRY